MNLNINNLSFNGRLIMSDKDKQSSEKAFKKVGVDTNTINKIPVGDFKGDIYANVNYSKILHRAKTIRVNYAESPMAVNDPSDLFIYSLECDPKTMDFQLPKLIREVKAYSANSKKIIESNKISDNKLQIVNNPIMRGIQRYQSYDYGKGAKTFFNSLADIANTAKDSKGVTKMYYDNKTNKAQYVYVEDNDILRCGEATPEKSFQQDTKHWISEMPEYLTSRDNLIQKTNEIKDNKNIDFNTKDNVERAAKSLSIDELNTLSSAFPKVDEIAKQAPGIVSVSIKKGSSGNNLNLGFYKTYDGTKEQIKSNTFKIDDKLNKNLDGLTEDMPKFLNQWDKFNTTINDMTSDNDKILINEKAAKSVAMRQDSKSLKSMTEKLAETNKKAQEASGHMDIKFDNKDNILVTHDPFHSASETRRMEQESREIRRSSYSSYNDDDNGLGMIAEAAALGMGAVGGIFGSGFDGGTFDGGSGGGGGAGSSW